VAVAVVAALTAGCGAPPASRPAEQQAPAFALTPVADVIAAAGLEWIVVARPREIASRADLAPALRLVVPEARLAAFSAKNGLDPRGIDELAIARYAETTLYVARARVDPGRVEASFTSHLATPRGRALDRGGGIAEQLVRVSGEAADGPEQLAIFGTDGVALELGKPGPLRAAELFAEKKLRRASPALRAVPLARAAEMLEDGTSGTKAPAWSTPDAPLRMLAPGPFRGEWSKGLAGLLAATTAVGISARLPTPIPTPTPTPIPISIHLVLTGAWGGDAGAASDRLSSAFDTMAASGLGHLCGLDRPIIAAKSRAAPDAIALDVTVDGLEIARGLHMALEAEVDEIMRYGERR
jgi:hypothetical protein